MPASIPRRIDRDDIIVALAVEPVIGEDRARRYRLHDLAPHEALGQLRVFGLLADRDPVALLATSRRKYSAAALTGTPASGTSAAPPLLRDVSVRPRSRAASRASSSNIS